jgi:hypothetical protein
MESIYNEEWKAGIKSPGNISKIVIDPLNKTKTTLYENPNYGKFKLIREWATHIAFIYKYYNLENVENKEFSDEIINGFTIPIYCRSFEGAKLHLVWLIRLYKIHCFEKWILWEIIYSLGIIRKTLGYLPKCFCNSRFILDEIDIKYWSEIYMIKQINRESGKFIGGINISINYIGIIRINEILKKCALKTIEHENKKNIITAFISMMSAVETCQEDCNDEEIMVPSKLIEHIRIMPGYEDYIKQYT